ncbi:S-adenosyl-L-methionine-dependent methyltransferase [Polychaeton citri CBS 116435]|uniref:S-adenosyl-L-methionine-dependent methyltransferase n=1 Tax=Polychaeton citri CBS 116435 TaxID=1314669 RepID=A0A9P4Q988_9PEZI|nr:S-adenosyl-L-methionine-dependent methyltransferase [Polychaeton citri CBS 116435]
MIRDQGIHQFPDSPLQKNPFEYTFGKPIFEYFKDDKEQKEAFDNYMTIRRDPNAPQWFDTYPVEDCLGASLKSGPNDALLIDVGGGKGHEISKFQRRFPHLPGRRILQDLPQTIRAIDSKPADIELMEHDFFTEQPVKGARMYYLRAVMHDWSDSKCKVILSRIVEAMDKDYSRILIDDYVLPNTKAGWRAASMDVFMMLVASGIERTQRQWDQLLSSVDLEIVKVWKAKAGSESIIEARIRSS